MINNVSNNNNNNNINILDISTDELPATIPVFNPLKRVQEEPEENIQKPRRRIDISEKTIVNNPINRIYLISIEKLILYNSNQLKVLKLSKDESDKLFKMLDVIMFKVDEIIEIYKTTYKVDIPKWYINTGEYNEVSPLANINIINIIEQQHNSITYNLLNQRINESEIPNIYTDYPTLKQKYYYGFNYESWIVKAIFEISQPFSKVLRTPNILTLTIQELYQLSTNSELNYNNTRILYLTLFTRSELDTLLIQLIALNLKIQNFLQK